MDEQPPGGEPLAEWLPLPGVGGEPLADGVGAVVGATAPPQPAGEVHRRHDELDGHLHRPGMAGLEGLGLGQRAREPVEEHLGRAVEGVQCMPDDLGHDVVGDQAAGVDRSLHLPTEG